MSNCPKCNEKLSPFYFKPTCPKCGANLLYYNLEERLQEDADVAASEWGAVDRLLNGIKASVIGSLPAIIRTVSYFITVALLLVPCYIIQGLPTENISLLTLIKMLISGDIQFGDILSDKTLLLALVSFAAVVLIGLVSLVLSLLSYTKNGYKRNMALTIIDIAVFFVLFMLTFLSGCAINIVGIVLITASMILTLVLHKSVDKALKK